MLVRYALEKLRQAVKKGQLRTKGPFNLTQNTETVRFRSRGRQARIKLENNATGTEWRYGELRLDIQDDGLR